MTVLSTTTPGRERDRAIFALADEVNARLLEGEERVLAVTNQRDRLAEVRLLNDPFGAFGVVFLSGSRTFDMERFTDSLAVAEAVERWLR